MTTMENRTYDEIAIGESAEVTREVTRADIELFAVVSGDVNPAHLDDVYASGTRFKGVIMHGMWSGAIVSSLLGVHLPGPGTIYLSQSLAFKRPVTIGDRITFKVTVKEKRDDKKIVVLECTGVNQDGKTVVDGEAVVMAPSEKLAPTAPAVPQVSIARDGGPAVAYVRK
ncbi:MaoC/PaaZ C-terminal domain-containing protein [Pinisolibacter aquiterrae]|uniref:MaoC/PaaZ C-terminal domain-containing protein n=1 Tax=Pinisolibacter aquiterrae TaxID=2815579 RepID=UPI001C3E1C07|nr:MaoC/PaaZ C-terminal domain-containing protein [Pinisolibacter aquiterrae]MBV5266266.1 MaoC family dehydratase N-terminal domain-containing protein [Pinisolibacter aquiterrae]MCC8236354.1 MaoC family dehydratase N-terminal domain-containing protein [Pinisolibacter aquiterrae]